MKRVRSATRPIPTELREAFFLAVWDLALTGNFYRSVPAGAEQFLARFGSGSLAARRHGLTILWLTALAGRFGELAALRVCDVEGCSVAFQRSKGGARQTAQVDSELIAATSAWHEKVIRSANDVGFTWKQRKYAAAMAASEYLLPSCSGSRLSCDVFNRDTAGPIGRLFGIKVTSHCFRDTACQVAMQLVKKSAGLDVRAVQALMGHRSAATTEHYLRKQTQDQLVLPLH